MSAALEQPTTAAHRALKQQPVVYVDETGAPTGKTDGRNPTGKRGWRWVAMSPVVTVFLQGTPATVRQQGRDVWQFLEQAWIAHHHGGVMPSLLSDP